MKTLAVIVLATLSTAIGEALLSVGMKQVGDISALGPHQYWKMFYMFFNLRVLGGIFFMAVFFGLYSAALSWADLSFAQPLTALTFVFGILIARFALHEEVSVWRWLGAFTIVVGVAIISMDRRQLTDRQTSSVSAGQSH